MSRMSKEVAMYLKSYNQMGPGLKSAGASLDGLRKKANKIFADIAKAGAAAMAAVATGATLVGAAFEQGMANTSSMFITSAKSAEQLSGWTADLAEKARQLGAETAFTATEVTTAMYSLASGGLAANQVIAATDGVLKLAGATMTDMGSSAELTMASMRQFGLEATDSDRIVNVFAAGIQNSMLNMERLGLSMVYAGPKAAALGLEIEETVASLALLHNAGLKGSIAGTGLRMTFSKLINPSKELREVLNGVTVEADGLGAVLDAINAASLGADKMTTMFGERAFNAITALVNAGSDGLSEMTKNVTGTTAAFQMYEHQMKTLTGQWNIFKSATQETGLAIFEVLSGPLTAGVKDLQEAVGSTRELFVQLFRETLDGINKMVEGIVTVSVFLRENRATVETVGVALTIAATAALSLAYGIAAVSATVAILTNPLALVVIGITAISVAMAEMGGVTLTFAGTWEAVTDAYSASFPIISGVLIDIDDWLTSAGKSASNFMDVMVDNRDIIEGIGIVAGTTATAIGLLMVARNLHVIATVASSVFQSVQMGIMNAQIVVVDILTASIAAQNAVMAVSPVYWIIAAIGAFIGIVLVAVKELGGWEKAWIKLKAASKIAFEWIQLGIFRAVLKVSELGDAFDVLTLTVSLVFNAIWELVKDFASKVGVTFKGIAKLIVNPFKAKETWDELKKGLEGGLLDAFDGIDKIIEDEWGKVGDIQKIQLDALAKDAAEAIAQIKSDLIVDLANIDLDQITVDVAPVIAKDFSTAEDSIFSQLMETGILYIPISPVIDKDFTVPDDSIFDLLMDTSHIEDNLKSVSWAGTEAMGIIHDSANKAMRGVTNAISDAVFEGKNLLESLGDVAKNVFGFILTSFLRMGVSALVPGLGEIGGFAQGGLVHGTAGVDKILAMVSNLEYVMPVAQTQKYLPELEAMRAGTYERNAPSLSMAGGRGGGSQLSLSVVFERGTLTILDNDLSVDRLATKIWDNAEKGIATLYDKD